MKLCDLLERRRNPEQNPKLSDVEFLRQYKDNPNMYLHTTSVLKVGIFPRSSASLDSPAGVYAYRLADIWEDTIERWNTGEYNRGLEFLPFHGGDHLFILESNIDHDFPGHYSEADLATDCEKLKQLYGLSDGRIAQLKRTATTNENFVDVPAGYLWGMTKAFVAGVSELDSQTWLDTRKWNHLLRRLGYVGFNDPGMGLIHGAEPSQAVFLTHTAYRVVDHMLKNRRQRMVKFGGKTYVGGRLPKDLHMAGIENTLFYNHTPEDFRQVRRWTVDGMSIGDLAMFKKFLPWNAIGIVKTLAIGNAANEDYEYGQAKDFFSKPLPKNIKIENLWVGSRMPVMLINKIPADYPIDTITINPFAMKNGLDSLPEPLRSKIRVHPLK